MFYSAHSRCTGTVCSWAVEGVQLLSSRCTCAVCSRAVGGVVVTKQQMCRYNVQKVSERLCSYSVVDVQLYMHSVQLGSRRGWSHSVMDVQAQCVAGQQEGCSYSVVDVHVHAQCLAGQQQGVQLHCSRCAGTVCSWAVGGGVVTLQQMYRHSVQLGSRRVCSCSCSCTRPPFQAPCTQ